VHGPLSGLDPHGSSGTLTHLALTEHWRLAWPYSLACSPGPGAPRCGPSAATSSSRPADSALGVVTAGLALAPDVPVVAFACAAAFGGAYIALSGVLIAWGTQLHPDSPGSANATLFLTLAAGQALGALLLGSSQPSVEFMVRVR